jgi:hypothetical protein
MAEHHDELEAAAQVIDRILEAAEDFGAETIPGDADDEEIIGALVEDQLDRHSGVRATEHGSIGTLLRGALFAGRKPQIAWVDRDDPPRCSRSILEVAEERGDRPASRVEAIPRLRGVRRTPAHRRFAAIVPIGDFDDLHGDPSAATDDESRSVTARTSGR